MKRVMKTLIFWINSILMISKNSEIFFICKSGTRSMHAALILESNGYNNLYNVEDGFVIGWKPGGLPSK